MRICREFRILRNYDEKIEDVLIRGKLKHLENGPYDREITSEHFPTKYSGWIVREMFVVCFNRLITMPDALYEFSKARLHAAELGDLLDFRIEQPFCAREVPFFELGSNWKGKIGYFSGHGGKCQINLLDIDDKTQNKFADTTHFLVYADNIDIKSPDAKEASGDFLFFFCERCILELVRTHFSEKILPRKSGKEAEPHR